MARYPHSPSAVLTTVLLCLASAVPGTATERGRAPERGAGGFPQDADLTLQARIAVAPQIAQRRGWYRDFQCATLRAGSLLQSAIDRNLRIRDRVAWVNAPEAADLHELRSGLIRDIDHDGADLVIGILPATPVSGTAVAQVHEDGLAAYSQGYLVLRLAEPLCDAGNLLAHEIAHIFGGIHRRGEDNLMDPLAPGTRVDELNAALFALHRRRMIRAEAPPLRGEMLRMMWGLSRADAAAAQTWLRVGVIAASMGQPEAACAHYQRAIGIDPGLHTAWVNMGHARLQLEQFDAAERAYSAALSLRPDDGTVHNNLAVVYMSVGRPKEAEASMKRAIELGYDVPDGLREAIRAAVGGGNRD